MASPLNFNDLIINRSDRSGVGEFSVTIHEFPADAPSSFTPARAAYGFWYRPRTEKGDTWVTVPELGLSQHHISRNHVLVSPPAAVPPGIRRAVKCLEADFADDLSLDQLARGLVNFP